MKTENRNFIVGVTSEALWGLGFGLINPPTILSLALVDLGGSSTLAGLLASIFGAGLTLPQAFSALILPPRFTDPKRMVLIHLPAILGPLLAGLGFAFIPPTQSFERLVLLLTGFTLFSFGIGVVVPHWVGCIGRCIPEKIRGRYFGACFFTGGLCASATGWLGAHWIQPGGLEWGYACCFLLSMPCMLASLGSMLFFKPLVGPPLPPPPGALGASFRLMKEKLMERGPFQTGLALVLLLTLVSAPGNLFTVYLRGLGVDSWFRFFTPAMPLGVMIGSLGLGWISDHRGYRAAYAAAFSAGLASLGLIYFHGNPVAPSSAFAGMGFLNSAFPVVTLVMILKIAGHQESTIQQGLFNTLMSPWSFLAPLCAGWLAARAGYPVVFTAASFCCLAGLALLWKNPDPDQKPATADVVETGGGYP